MLSQPGEMLFDGMSSETAVLKAALAHVPVGVTIVSAPSGKVLYMNPAVERIMRQPVAACQSVAEYAQWVGYRPDGSPYTAEEWPVARAIRHGEIVFWEEIRVHRGDGSEGIMTVNAAPIFASAGHLVGGVVIFADITDRKQMEEALRRSHQQLANLLDSIHQVFVSLDPAWRITYLNHAAREHVRRYINRPIEAFLGKVLWEIAPQLKGTPTEENLRRALTEQTPVRFEQPGVFSQRWFEFTVFPSPEGLTLLARDIHEAKMAQLALQEKVLELERFQEAVVGRELKMMELEKEVARLRDEVSRLRSATGQRSDYGR